MDNFDDYMKDAQERATMEHFMEVLEGRSEDELKEDVYRLAKANYELRQKLKEIRRAAE